MKKLGELKSFVGGIADSKKIGIPYSFAWGRALDFRSDPSNVSLNQRSERQAVGVITDLPMWMDAACDQLYAAGNTGNIYLKDADDNWSVDHIAPNSQGNGLVFFPEDNYLYAPQNKTIARKSDACTTTGTWYDGFLESEGGEPTNAQSILFVRTSSQYASIADNASLSITGDITLESYIKLTSLPTTSQVFTLISKWNENGNQRSYKFDITTSSNAFGDGRDSSLTISSNSVEDPIDANCVGTSGTYTLTISNAHASFASVAAGDKVLIHQTRGTNVGLKQIATVQGYSGGTLTIREALTFSPAHSATAGDANKAQIRVLKQYTNVTINSGITYSAKPWSQSTGKGGILGFLANGTVAGPGKLSATACGFAGGAANGSTTTDGNDYGYAGEGTAGATFIVSGATRNGNGGGGGHHNGNSFNIGIGGGGGGNGTVGYRGAMGQTTGGLGGSVSSTTDLTTMTFGGGGGGGAGVLPGSIDQSGGDGGGMIVLYGATVSSTLGIENDGEDGKPCVGFNGGGAQACGGAGGAGATLVVANTATAGASLWTAEGGWGTDHGNQLQFGDGYGGSGIIAVYYGSSFTGITSPTANTYQDTTLNTTDGYVLRLLISSTGTNTETYTQDITSILQTGVWNRWQVTWSASTSTANFYQSSSLLSTQVGALTAIFNSTARFAIATSYDSSGTAHDFLDARMDDTRVWNDVRTSTELATYNDQVMLGVESNFSAYYKFEGNVNDSQTVTTTSNLTATNTPTYSADVPFSGITTRADQDIHINASGNTYTLGTTLSEGATDRQTFAPTKEPVKSLALNINTVGTGNWTVVVHDGLNRLVATMTVANAQLHTGIYEFIFASSFRPILTANYHVHVYSTVGDGKIVTSSLNDMEGSTGNTGAYLDTFFQILVEDQYHPAVQFLNFVAIGNERYVGKLEAGNLWNPHQITLPAGYRVRCLAFWNEYLAIGTWRGDAITDSDSGKIFLWNGTDDSISLPPIDVPEGGVDAMFGSQGNLFIIAGYEGKLLVSSDGAHTQKIGQIPLLETNEYMEVAPGAMTMWRSILRIGATLNTDSTHVHQGIYGYGRLNSLYPYSMGFDIPLSIGDQQTSMVKVGSAFPFGQKLYFGYQNGNAFGIDSVSVTNQPFSSGRIELLLSDLGHITKRKIPLVFEVNFEPLIAGQSITLEYKKNDEDHWRIIPEAVENDVGATFAVGHINDSLTSIQLAIDIANTATTSPVINQVTLEEEGEDDASNTD